MRNPMLQIFFLNSGKNSTIFRLWPVQQCRCESPLLSFCLFHCAWEWTYVYANWQAAREIHLSVCAPCESHCTGCRFFLCYTLLAHSHFVSSAAGGPYTLVHLIACWRALPLVFIYKSNSRGLSCAERRKLGGWYLSALSLYSLHAFVWLFENSLKVSGSGFSRFLVDFFFSLDKYFHFVHFALTKNALKCHSCSRH